MQNPPLACYYIAMVAAVTGVHEVALHLAFLVPALLLAFGMLQLAKSMCLHPALAAALAIVTPVFVISGTTVMCDMFLTCFWVWAVFLWDRGLRLRHWPSLACAGMLVGLAFLSKYPGINLLPLLAAYTLVRRAPLKYLAFLVIPIAFVAAYELITFKLYGTRLFGQAGLYSSIARARRGAGFDLKVFTSLTFTGGCLLPALLLAPLIWRVQTLMLGAAVSIGVLVLLATSDTEKITQLRVNGEFNWSLAIQGSILVTAGINVLAISLLDLWKRRNAESILLALWILGVFVFAGMMNWSVNGRSILPMAPAVAIVLVRRMEDAGAFERSWAARWALPGAILASMAFSMLMAWADYSLASASRRAAQSVCAKYGHTPGGVMFQGHWGFQYYVQQCRARHFEFLKTPLLEGDLVAVPIYNTNVMWLDAEVATEIDRLDFPTLPWLSVMNRGAGAGFYADAGGPLPFVFGPIPVEEYHIMRIDAPFDPADYPNLAPATAPAP
jgi:4-amino-4-deoxy-L-arabinose transferase-like glycosyltransferase